MDGGAWWAAVHGVTKSRTWLSDFTFTFHFHALEKEMATRSSVLAWRIPGTGEPGGLASMGSHRVRHDWSDLAVAGQNTGVGSLSILQGIFPTQGSNQVSRIAGRFFTNWAIREVQTILYVSLIYIFFLCRIKHSPTLQKKKSSVATLRISSIDSCLCIMYKEFTVCLILL